MSLSVRKPPYKIPEYSLTGDLLAYLMCGLQYRYHSKGSLPPSTPVQLWFGEFIHGVMEEAYVEWKQNQDKKRFPWNWEPDIREIELRINQRLKAKGLMPTPGLFCPYDSSYESKGCCPNRKHPHVLVASRRADEAINTWGPHLFPLIEEAEVKLKGLQEMPGYQEGISRCNYYGITGIIDVISSVNIVSAPPGNLILHHINQDPKLRKTLNDLAAKEYEIIIDYKGMRRPAVGDHSWKYHEQQILTYGWLRSQQPQAQTVVAGIIFYLNELALSGRDMEILQKDICSNSTDIMPQKYDSQVIRDWKSKTPLPLLSTQFREQRSMRIIEISDERMQESLKTFNGVVREIESCVFSEMSGEEITSCWHPKPVERNCTVCDCKTFCPGSTPHYYPTVP